jgi:hypothetical protein
MQEMRQPEIQVKAQGKEKRFKGKVSQQKSFLKTISILLLS